MENPFVIGLLIVAGIIYKIYTSYKEEMEKAKKRMETLKKQSNKIEVPVEKKQSNSKYTPPNLPKREVKIPKLIIEKEIPEEVSHLKLRKLAEKEIKKNILDDQKKKVIKTEKELTRRSNHFDLREAIIQQAILNRPYQD